MTIFLIQFLNVVTQPDGCGKVVSRLNVGDKAHPSHIVDGAHHNQIGFSGSGHGGGEGIVYAHRATVITGTRDRPLAAVAKAHYRGIPLARRHLKFRIPANSRDVPGIIKRPCGKRGGTDAIEHFRAQHADFIAFFEAQEFKRHCYAILFDQQERLHKIPASAHRGEVWRRRSKEFQTLKKRRGMLVIARRVYRQLVLFVAQLFGDELDFHAVYEFFVFPAAFEIPAVPDGDMSDRLPRLLMLPYNPKFSVYKAWRTTTSGGNIRKRIPDLALRVIDTIEKVPVIVAPLMPTLDAVKIDLLVFSWTQVCSPPEHIKESGGRVSSRAHGIPIFCFPIPVREF